MGISGDEFNVMLGIVSWATCGTGRSRGAGRGAAGAEGRAAGAEGRAAAGRRAKRVLDWARVQFLRERGFSATLCRFVPSGVSPENICIVASKRT